MRLPATDWQDWFLDSGPVGRIQNVPGISSVNGNVTVTIAG